MFVDAVGTGWSTVVARGKTSDYYGVDEDAKAFTQFIQRWVTHNARWQSPKFLFGESYGTTRAANVVNLLQTAGLAVNGVVLLSSALDYNFLPIGQGPGEDYAYVGYLPTEAAVAWYHHKAAGNPPDLARFVADVRAFAGGPYAQALMRGDSLDAATRAQIVAKLHAYLGLDEKYINAANLRIDPNRFEQELLRSEGRIVGRLDGRYTGAQIDRNATFPDYDSSSTMTSAAYVAAFNHYAHDVLHYRDERPYDVLDFGVNRAVEVPARRGLQRAQRRRRSAVGDRAEPVAARAIGERLLRSGDQVLRDRISAEPHGAQRRSAQAAALFVLCVRASGVLESRLARAVQGRSGAVLSGGGWACSGGGAAVERHRRAGDVPSSASCASGHSALRRYRPPGSRDSATPRRGDVTPPPSARSFAEVEGGLRPGWEFEGEAVR